MGSMQPCCFDNSKKNGKRKSGLTRLTKLRLKSNYPPNLYNYKSRDEIKEIESKKSNNNNNKTYSYNASKNVNKSQNDNNLSSGIIIRKRSRKLQPIKNFDNMKSDDRNLNKSKETDISQHEKSSNNKIICDDYIKGELKGMGRFGKVYSGLGSNSGNMVTIKIFENLNDDIKKKIINNLDNLYDLKHENILKIISIIDDKEKNEFSLVYEFCNYHSIEGIIQKFGVLDEKIIQKYFKQLLQGLHYLHNKKIIHKNLKPSNILIDSQGMIKISDCLIDNIILGTKKNIYDLEIKNDININYYIPPFFIQNIDDNDIGQEYDFWFLGCLIIEISSGKKPWSHYNFNNSEKFFNFLKGTHLIPTIPKKLSVQCQQLIKILFNPEITKQNNIYDIIFNLDFFKMDVENFTYQNANKNFTEKNIIINSNNGENISENEECSLNNININININNSIQLGQILANNKVINLLNNNNNATFSISLSGEQSSSISSSTIYNNNSTISNLSKGFGDFPKSLSNLRNKKNRCDDMSEVIEAKLEQSPDPIVEENKNKFSFDANNIHKNKVNIMNDKKENEDHKIGDKNIKDNDVDDIGNRYIV